MAKSNRAYKSAKRGRELKRQQKAEEKRLRRLAKLKSESGDEPASNEAPKDPETPEGS